MRLMWTVIENEELEQRLQLAFSPQVGMAQGFFGENPEHVWQEQLRQQPVEVQHFVEFLRTAVPGGIRELGMKSSENHTVMGVCTNTDTGWDSVLDAIIAGLSRLADQPLEGDDVLHVDRLDPFREMASVDRDEVINHWNWLYDA